MASLWRLRSYVYPYRVRLLVMLLAAEAGVAATIGIPMVVRAIVDGPIAHDQRELILPLGLLALLLGTGESFLRFLRRWLQAGLTSGIEYSIRRDLYEHFQKLPPSFHDDWQTGQLLSRATSDLSIIRRLFGFGLVMLVVSLTMIASVIVLLFRLDALLATLVAALLLPLIPVTMRFHREFRSLSRLMQEQRGDLTTAIEEAATGIRVIKAFGRRRHVAKRFDARARKVHHSQVGRARLQGTFLALLDLVPSMAIAIVLLLGGFAIDAGRLTAGDLVAFVLYVLQLIFPTRAFGMILAHILEGGTAAQRLYEVLDTEPAIADRPKARPLKHAKGRLTLENLGFRYPNSGDPVLRGVNLAVEPGETIALVGRTGSGKSTLISLIPRLADVTAGRICIDGVDIRDIRLSSLRGIVSVAFEEPILFSASARENLLLGAPNATDEQLRQAIDLAQADFVYALPWGLDTRIGEQGLSLSGGQRQRLAFARAVLARPKILVLDDPLSALDVHTESLVEEALGRVLDTTTALIAVHRPSTVALADRVALLDGGTITAVGTHSELLSSVPEYRAILSAEAESDEDWESLAGGDLSDRGLTGRGIAR